MRFVVTSTVNVVDYMFTIPVIEYVRHVTYLKRSNHSGIFIPHGCPHVLTDIYGVGAAALIA